MINKTVSRDVMIRSGSNELSKSKREENRSKLQRVNPHRCQQTRIWKESLDQLGHSRFTLGPGVEDPSIAALTHMTMYRGAGTRCLSLLLLARTSCSSVVRVWFVQRRGQFLHLRLHLIFASYARRWSTFSKQRATILHLPFSLRSLEKAHRPARLFTVLSLIYQFAVERLRLFIRSFLLAE
jgi:hypothetical protein